MPTIFDLFTARDLRENAMSAYHRADRAHRKGRSEITRTALVAAHSAWIDACDYADSIAAALGITR